MTERRLAIALLAVGAALWSVLCVGLHRAGHAPSGPTPLDGWYGVQAALVWGVVPLQGWLVGRVGARLSGVAPDGRWSGAVGFGTAVVLFVLTDLVAWQVVGFDGLGGVLAVTAPTALVVGVGVGAWRLRNHGATVGRALLAMLGALVVAGVVGGPFLR